MDDGILTLNAGSSSIKFALFARRDPYQRFFSCLLFVARDAAGFSLIAPPPSCVSLR